MPDEKYYGDLISLIYIGLKINRQNEMTSRLKWVGVQSRDSVKKLQIFISLEVLLSLLLFYVSRKSLTFTEAKFATLCKEKGDDSEVSVIYYLYINTHICISVCACVCVLVCCSSSSANLHNMSHISRLHGLRVRYQIYASSKTDHAHDKLINDVKQTEFLQ